MYNLFKVERIRSKKAVDPLINTLTTGRVSYVRMEAAEALGGKKDN